jgi:hypothetical protein
LTTTSAVNFKTSEVSVTNARDLPNDMM